VQGVWFRDSTRREAERLGITGHAINLDNGDVEVLACGSADALDALYCWLLQGPPLAEVSAVEQSPAEREELPGFRIG
jgi:acylphosphatase